MTSTYPLTPSEFADDVYGTLAAQQVGYGLRCNDNTVTVASVQLRCYFDSAVISFPDPYTASLSYVRLTGGSPTTVVAIIDGLLTSWTHHLVSFIADGPYCCGQTMDQESVGVRQVPGMPAMTETLYRCPVCSDLDVVMVEAVKP